MSAGNSARERLDAAIDAIEGGYEMLLAYAAGSDVTSLSSRIKTFHKAPGDRIGEYTLDANDSAVINAELANGAIGPIQATRWATGNLNDIHLSLYGDKGGLRVMTDGKVSSLAICAGADIDTQTWVPVDLPATPRNEERFVIALLSGENGEPDFRHATRVQRLLDLAFVSDAEGRMLPVA